MNSNPDDNNLQPFPIFETLSPQLNNLHQSLTTLQTHCSNLFLNLQHQTKHVIHSAFSHINPNPHPFSKNPTWARVSVGNKATTQFQTPRKAGPALATDIIEERLAGVPVYALSNSNEEFVLVSGVSSGNSLGLLCFKKEDAETLLEQMRSMDPGMRKAGSKVVAVALNKVFQLKVDGVSFRLIPEPSQVKNAIQEREKAGFSNDGFSGVPVFQSRSLVLRSQNKSYRPVFFRKEDLDKSLQKAASQQNKLNPAFRQGDIQVAVLEDVIKSMKEGASSNWDNVVFIPPGFDVSTDASQL